MRGFCQAVLDCHAQFGGDLVDMQRRYDEAVLVEARAARARNPDIAGDMEAPPEPLSTTLPTVREE